ncbi:MBL fold metallo-hydrolase [Litoribrevibacter albus]|uniref:MBL fold metallo-hydrolase n=1 Tax=Litoribrevibacter albus TaxID=1473156 RepID=A0AA37S6P9_9GAMM|nr:MBL fold metallo-hydrolase [Litoribrevibacter albus]GLQ30210.1 MBL fold metallo-hydrolase [Litoribrevibacter albus]
MKHFTLIIGLLASLSVWSEEVKFSSIITGYSSGALESTIVENGSWFNVRYPVHQAIYIKHPKGDLLFDTGLGRQTAGALQQQSWLDRQLFAISEVQGVKDQLEQQGMSIDQIKAIIPSHLHWDHTGGLPDLLGIPVWAQQAGIDFALNEGTEPGFLKAHLVDEILWQPLVLETQSYMGFAKSLDIYKDGTLVLVGLEGHTPGQVGLFINLNNGQRYFFIGDTTWTLTGVMENLPRPAITQWLLNIDQNLEKNNAQVQKIHDLKQQYPELIIVPAHDQFVAKTLPHFPDFNIPTDFTIPENKGS